MAGTTTAGASSVRAVDAVFLDIRDTLGEVDRPGHLVPYRPSTEKLLDFLKSTGVIIGAITNLPANLSADAGKDMLVNAVLSFDANTKKTKTIGEYIRREHIITNKDAGADKPDIKIYQHAANAVKLPLDRCLFSGENYIEVLAAAIWGFRHKDKLCPPGRDFLPAFPGKLESGPLDSGRQFEAMLEHEHLLGERIFACGDVIARQMAALIAGKTPPLDQKRWISPPAITIPAKLRSAIAYFVHLIEHFADQVHLRAEEAMAEVAIACGMERSKAQWMFDQHDQARAYWAAMQVAWRRIQNGDADDRFFAIGDFQKCIEAFVFLFKAHAVREDAQLYPTAGGFFNDSDDAMVLNIIQHSGPSDITPYIGMVERMELALDIARS